MDDIFSEIYLPLIEICPDMSDPNHTEQDAPASKRACPSPDTFLVENIPYEQGSENLGHPIEETVQRSSTDVEHGCVIVVEFYKIDVRMTR